MTENRPIGEQENEDLRKENKRLREALLTITNDGCGMARIRGNRTLWCPDLYERDDWCWCCIALLALVEIEEEKENHNET